MGYNEVAFANAQVQGLLAEEVALLGYREIAALSEVTIDADGLHPDTPDFIYRNVRNAVVVMLAEAELLAERKEEEDLLKASLKLIKESKAGKKLSAKAVYRNEDGDLVIK